MCRLLWCTGCFQKTSAPIKCRVPHVTLFSEILLHPPNRFFKESQPSSSYWNGAQPPSVSLKPWTPVALQQARWVACTHPSHKVSKSCYYKKNRVLVDSKHCVFSPPFQLPVPCKKDVCLGYWKIGSTLFLARRFRLPVPFADLFGALDASKHPVHL